MKSTWLIVLGAVTSVAVAQDEDPESRRQKYPNCLNGTLAQNKVCDRTLSPPERAAALVEALTVEEKLQNLVSKAKGAPRIGLPAYNWWSEALHGVAYAPGTYFTEGDAEFNSSTSYPMPLLMAAAFDDELIERIGTAIGTESRAWGNSGWGGLDWWTPNVNPFKDPRWGRGSETPGEDVLRVKRYAEYMTRGLDGPVPGEQRRIISTCKHYAGNDFEDWNGTSRHDFDAKITLQDLAEYYMMPFQQCARDSKVGSIMCAYNAVNGVPSCANTYLLQTILREHWNWTEHNNYVTSDCEAVLDVSANHKYAPTNAAGTALCFEAGTDTSCEYEGSSDIPGAWSQGLLKEETVDRALLRLYEGLVRAGYFDGHEAVYAALGWKDVNSPEAQSLALQAAVEGIVLLKNNNGTLPLHLKPSHKVAMVGFWADAPDKLQGGYSGRAAHLHTPAYAARQLGLDIAVASGPVLQKNNASDNWTAAALEAAGGADYILYFGGLDTSAAGETLDRTNLEWPEAQLTLIKKLSGLGKPLVVNLLGDQLDDTPLLELDEVNSILWANWPGQDGGVAIMKLITGEKSPAGRLPVTQYPSSYTDLIPMTDMHLRPTCKYPGRTYRWYDKPIKRFGFGLHYTTFEAEVGAAFPKTLKIADLVGGCANEHPDTCPAPPLPVSVTNTGDRASDYVVLAYLSGEYGPRPYPIKTLSAYKRLRDVGPGETATVDLAWTLGDIARHDEEGDTVLYPGEYTITIDEPTLTTATFTFEGEEAVLDKWPAPPS
ncbi:putative glycosyl hydrolase family 3 N terminal domain-containing protein [Colletotrichum sublineola]|uniref:xylan 1,4-beta-xylosidase n=1 Tax=Colletotrichum sublineola TaxID=1173701 RepID=A0A066XX64_COLSU|nr:putative glycosyl hydrolase family 3 N terminal domain-containing protein [Colletotrichum sublineola]